MFTLIYILIWHVVHRYPLPVAASSLNLPAAPPRRSRKHNLAWQQPHVESGAGFSKLTSCDAVAASRQVCACMIFSEERWASSRMMPPREVDDSVVRSGGMVTRRPPDKVVLAFVIPHRRRQVRCCCGGVDKTIKKGVVSKIENNMTIKCLADIAA